jgi:hypothetical protein
MEKGGKELRGMKGVKERNDTIKKFGDGQFNTLAIKIAFGD